MIESKEWVNRILLYKNMVFKRIIQQSYKIINLGSPENILLLMEVSWLSPKFLKIYVSNGIEEILIIMYNIFNF
jgi:hypothetical protein